MTGVLFRDLEVENEREYVVRSLVLLIGVAQK